MEIKMPDNTRIEKEHFDVEVLEKDKLTRKLIPRYDSMQEAVLKVIDLPTKLPHILDLSVGTGDTIYWLFKKYPFAEFDAFDILEDNVLLSKLRLKNNMNHVNFELDDVLYTYIKRYYYDAVIAVNFIHGFTSSDKRMLFSRAFNSLKGHGIFVIADLVRLRTKEATQAVEGEYREFVERNFSREDSEVWLEMHKYENLADSVDDQIKWLKAIGFREVECAWQFMNFAVIYAKKV